MSRHSCILLGFLAGMIFTAAHYYLFIQPLAAQEYNNKIKTYKSIIDDQESMNIRLYETNDKLKEYIMHLLKEKEKQDKLWKNTSNVSNTSNTSNYSNLSTASA